MAVEMRVVIAKIQRQKRKFVTAVAGLETVPGLKIKDAAKLFGKKFSSGASVQESASGAKEVHIIMNFYDILKIIFAGCNSRRCGV